MDLYVGIDIGTSGVRAVGIDSSRVQRVSAAINFSDIAGARSAPSTWDAAVLAVLRQLNGRVQKIVNDKHVQDDLPVRIKALAVDGTSGTVLLTDADGEPLCNALMYNDVCHSEQILDLIKEYAPDVSGAHGATSGLAKAMLLATQYKPAYIQHEADWITTRLTGVTGISDENNALKTGYDPVNREWPSWLDSVGVDRRLLPRVIAAGAPLGRATGSLAQRAGLSADVLVVAGTTDGCASFLATGAALPGDGVTVLGSTLTLKLLSPAPVFAPEYGVYSHRLGDQWLAGGASNSGGRVLSHYFTQQQIETLSRQCNTDTETGLDYYPLLGIGERFPINDSSLDGRIDERPVSDVEFLQGLLEGISGIEQLGYDRLGELSGLDVRSIRSTGGGAANPVWTAIRQRRLNVPFLDSYSDQASFGSAILALRAASDE